MAQVLGIGGIFFKSANPEKLAQWYQQWLGMKLSFPNGVMFQSAELPQTSYQVWSPFDAKTEYFRPSEQSFMLNLMVDDLEAILAKLADSGCQVMAETESSEYGEFGWFIDPDGNKIELWQPPQSTSE